MLKGYWRAFAYLGIAVLLGVWFGFSLGRIDVRDAEIYAEHQHNRTQEVSRYSYGFLPPWPASGAPVGDEEAYSSKDKTEQRDLAAQEWMAWLAFWMLIASCIGVAVGGVGLYYLKRTLDETRDATTATREVGENQVRAFVYAKSAEVIVKGFKPGMAEPSDFPSHVAINIENVGNSPAVAIEGHARIWSESDSGKKTDFVDLIPNQKSELSALVQTDPQPLIFVVPDGHFEPRIPNPITNAFATARPQPNRATSPGNAFASLLSGDWDAIECKGVIHYKDVFGDTFETEFHFRYQGRSNPGLIKLYPVRSGLRMFRKIRSREQGDPQD